MTSWKQYQKLNSEQREEYNFRFKNKRFHNPIMLSLVVIVLYLSMMSLIFTTYILVTNEEFKAEHGGNSAYMVKGIFQVIGVSFSTIFFYVVYDSGRNIYYSIMKIRFMRRCKENVNTRPPHQGLDYSNDII